MAAGYERILERDQGAVLKRVQRLTACRYNMRKSWKSVPDALEWVWSLLRALEGSPGPPQGQCDLLMETIKGKSGLYCAPRISATVAQLGVSHRTDVAGARDRVK